MVLVQPFTEPQGALSMSRCTTLQHALVAALATGVVFVAPAVAEPTDRIDRFDNPNATPAPHQDLRGEHPTDPAPPGSEKFQPGQPTWPTHPAPAPKTAIAPVSPTPAPDDGNDVWLIVGIGVAAAGIVAGSAAGVARRYRVRARRVAV
jgi:hypothetical protein